MKLRLLLLATVMLPCAAVAQTDPMAMARAAIANQVGLMEYCQGHGWADQAGVDAQRSSLSSLPPTSDTSGMVSAEAAGKAGNLLNNGSAMPLSAMASQTQTTVAALCGQLSASAKMVTEQEGAMPKMPGGMPSLPNGMTMPAMPGMPKSP